MSQSNPSERDTTWVEVEVQKGEAVSVYRGRALTSELERWRNGEFVRGALTLFDVYWSYEAGDGEAWVVVGATPGPYAAALGTAHIRADQVLVVIPLRDGGDRDQHRAVTVRRGEHDA